MVRVLENEYLIISVDEKGAELCSVIDKKTNKQLLWDADPAVWNRHAPLLFPYCGSLFDDELIVDGEKYPAAKHGFVRDMEFTCTLADATGLVFRLEANDETKRLYPYNFVLEVGFRLDGNILNQTVTVTNLAKDKKDVLPFSIGFHPGFKVPFGEGTQASDYEVYFDKIETPIEIKTEDGYVSGEAQVYFTEEQVLPLSDDLFAFDSICLSGLRSNSVSVREKKRPTNYIRVYTEKFPYVLLWSAATKPLAFLCIEPWTGLPDGPNRYEDFKNKNGITLLEAQKQYETTLQIEFHIQ